MSKPTKPKPQKKESHKETIARIAAENRAFFEKLEAENEIENSTTIVPKNEVLSAGNYCKMLCEHCRGKIEFPLSASGETVACPHCNKNIFLPYGLPVFAIASREQYSRQIQQKQVNKDAADDADTPPPATLPRSEMTIKQVIGIVLILGGLWLGYLVLSYAGIIAESSTSSGWTSLGAESARQGDTLGANYYQSRAASAERLEERKTQEVVSFFIIAASMIYCGVRMAGNKPIFP
jgi:hypothetical protein